MARTHFQKVGYLTPGGGRLTCAACATINAARLAVGSLSLEHLQLDLIGEAAQVDRQSVEHFALCLIGSQSRTRAASAASRRSFSMDAR